MYVTDCVKAIRMLLEAKNTKKRYYVGTGQSKKLKEYLYEARDSINPNLEIGIGERADDGLVYSEEWYSIADLNNDTGFSPEIAFSRGIKETVKYIHGANK
jgi:nucleoside-diphosphate-sugar epimerase